PSHPAPVLPAVALPASTSALTNPHLHSLPTRRSSDLHFLRAFGDAVCQRHRRAIRRHATAENFAIENQHHPKHVSERRLPITAFFRRRHQRFAFANPQCRPAFGPSLDMQAKALRRVSSGTDDALKIVQTGLFVLREADRRLKQRRRQRTFGRIHWERDEQLFVLVEAQYGLTILR